LHAVSETGKIDWFAVDFNVTQPVYTFGRIEEGVRQARIGRSIAVNQKEKKRAEIVFEVRKGYYQFVGASEMVRFLTEAEASTEVVAKMVKIGYETAVPEEKDEKGATRLDYLKARNFHSEVKARLSEAKKNLNLAELGLRMAMGFYPDAPLKVAAVSLESLPMNTWGIGELKQQTLEKNVDLKTVGLGIQFLDSRQKAATSEYFPKIGLFGNYVGPEDRFGNPNMWFVGVGLTVPLFDGFLTKAKIGQARAQFQKAKGQRMLLETALSVQIDHLQTSLVELKERAGIFESAIKEAAERTQLAADGYASGITDYEELLLAQKTEFELRAGYLQSLFLFQMTKSEIEYISGVQ
jgi:outer membrane protein TolC